MSKWPQIGAVIIGLVAGLAALAGTGLDVGRLLPAYLVAVLYWTELSLGCLGLLMLHYLTGGAWGFAVQRLLAAGARVLPLIVVLFIPLLLRLEAFYPWVSGTIEEDAALLPKSLYLSIPFFIGRTAIYFVIWISLTYILTNRSYRNDIRYDEQLLQRMIYASTGGLVLYLLTASFATFDWVMSLEPEWVSAVFGWLAVARQISGGAALAILILGLLWSLSGGRRQILPPSLTALLRPGVVNDLGNVLLAALLGWVYLAFIQYLVIWAGNIPHEVAWFERRLSNGWAWLALAFTISLTVPAALLLIRPIKRRIRLLALVAAFILLIRLANTYWLIMPAISGSLSFHWSEPAVFIGVGGLWLAVYLWQVGRHPLLPVNHPRLQEILSEQQEEEQRESLPYRQ